eukprot:scaffold1132_cov347-Pavlova_lutheri.AAC.10
MVSCTCTSNPASRKFAGCPLEFAVVFEISIRKAGPHPVASQETSNGSAPIGTPPHVSGAGTARGKLACTLVRPTSLGYLFLTCN